MEWNRANPDPSSRAYVDMTFSRWARRVFGLWYRLGGDIDQVTLCGVCDDVVFVQEDTRNPEHNLHTLIAVSDQLAVPGFLVILDGTAPRKMFLVRPGIEDPDLLMMWSGPFIQHWEGQLNIRLILGRTLLGHVTRAHPDRPDVSEVIATNLGRALNALDDE
jgi:hypothetical protein